MISEAVTSGPENSVTVETFAIADGAASAGVMVFDISFGKPRKRMLKGVSRWMKTELIVGSSTAPPNNLFLNFEKARAAAIGRCEIQIARFKQNLKRNAAAIKRLQEMPEPK